ncbi:MAG: carboxypeptidase regulatory-like domain-containing protein [Bacteroidota bacterium]
MKKTIVIAATLLLGCAKNSDHHAIIVPDVIQANNTRGNIAGVIYLYDEDGIRMGDNGYVTVSIDNSTVSTTTDASGKFQLDSIPAGTYDITYSRNGFGSGKIMGLYHAATNHATTMITKNESMAMNSTLAISNLVVQAFEPAVQQLGVNGFHIVPVFDNPSGKEKWVHLFFSDNSGVDASNFQAETKIKVSGSAAQLNNYNLTTNWFEGLGFQKGQTIYVKAYGDSFLADAYTNPLTNQTVFPSLSTKPSNTVSFVIPIK